MKPQTIGRVLGIGIRVAGRMAGQRLAGGAPASAAESAAPSAARQITIQGDSAQAASRAAGRTTGRATGSVAKGLGGLFRPFKRVGGILFLEVTGVFFFLFVLVFGQYLWRNRLSYAHGPDHQKFLVAAALIVVFLYLSVSSFWKARRK